jgi:hypothetical protein
VVRLREALDNQLAFATPLMQLQQRTWLMHWALHVYFNTDNGKNALIDLFLQPPFLSAIQINAQHLLRYLAAAVVLVARKRRNVMRELIKLIQQEAYEYSDPITQVRSSAGRLGGSLGGGPAAHGLTARCPHRANRCQPTHPPARPPNPRPAPRAQFIECLFVHYDFDGAQQKLAECEVVIENDYFLAATKADFMEAARNAMFETYCRIHQVREAGWGAPRVCRGGARAWALRTLACAGGQRSTGAAPACSPGCHAERGAACARRAHCWLSICPPPPPRHTYTLAVHRHRHAQPEAQHGQGGGGEVDHRPHPVGAPQRQD